MDLSETKNNIEVSNLSDSCSEVTNEGENKSSRSSTTSMKTRVTKFEEELKLTNNKIDDINVSMNIKMDNIFHLLEKMNTNKIQNNADESNSNITTAKMELGNVKANVEEQLAKQNNNINDINVNVVDIDNKNRTMIHLNKNEKSFNNNNNNNGIYKHETLDGRVSVTNTTNDNKNLSEVQLKCISDTDSCLVRNYNNCNHIRDAEDEITPANKDDLYNNLMQKIVLTENYIQLDKDSINRSILERVSLSDTMDNEEIEIIFIQCDDMEASDQYELLTDVSTDIHILMQGLIDMETNLYKICNSSLHDNDLISEVQNDLVESNVKPVVEVIQVDSILHISDDSIVSDNIVSVDTCSNLAIKEKSNSILLKDSILEVISDDVQSIDGNLILNDMDITTDYTNEGGNINTDYNKNIVDSTYNDLDNMENSIQDNMVIFDNNNLDNTEGLAYMDMSNMVFDDRNGLDDKDSDNRNIDYTDKDMDFGILILNSDSGYTINNNYMPNNIYVVDKSVMTTSGDISTDVSTSIIDHNPDLDSSYIDNENDTSKVHGKNNDRHVTNGTYTMDDFDFNESFKYIKSKYGYEGMLMNTHVCY